VDVERSLEPVRAAYAARAWRNASELLTSVDLEAEHLELVARSAHMIGLDDLRESPALRGFPILEPSHV
jgi:hypothetical protein